MSDCAGSRVSCRVVSHEVPELQPLLAATCMLQSRCTVAAKLSRWPSLQLWSCMLTFVGFVMPQRCAAQLSSAAFPSLSKVQGHSWAE